MKMEETDLVVIGEIIKPQGNKGELKVVLETDIPKRFEGLSSVLVVSQEGGCQSKEIERVRYYKDLWVILKFKDTPYSETWMLIGSKLCVPKESRPKLRENHFYHDEIIGLEVYTDEGKGLGKVTKILKTGANDVYVIEEDLLIPATKEVVKEVDLKRNRMLIHLIKGLV